MDARHLGCPGWRDMGNRRSLGTGKILLVFAIICVGARVLAICIDEAPANVSVLEAAGRQVTLER
jgi:hypothetical protein